MIGTTIAGRYEVVRRIGKGGMGEIFEVRHVKMARSFALKTLTGDGAKDPETVARFQREADVIARLRHPNIVEIVDWETLADGTPCLIMELLRGETLAARLARGALGWSEIASIGDEILSALAVAHQAGVVHRDLKPQNLFLALDDAGDERAKLLDFGVSKVRGSATFATTDARMIGTPAYMSPEQVDGDQDHVGPATDVWAMGAILSELATGKVAFAAPGVPQILYKICHRAPDPILPQRADAPAAFVALVEAALERDPAKRIGDVEALRTGLRTALAGVANTRPPARKAPPESIAASTGAGQATTLSSSIGQAMTADYALTTADPGAVSPSRPRRRGRLVGVIAAIAAIAAVAAILLATRTHPAAAPRPLARLALHVESAPAGDDLTPAVASLARRTLGADRRMTITADGEDADGTLAITFRRTAAGVALTLAATSGGRTQELAPVEAASVAEALAQAVPEVVALAGDSRPRPPSADERARMTLLAATSIEAFDSYARAEYETFRAISTDDQAIDRLTRETIALDPRWLRPHLLLAMNQGWTTDAALATLREARATCDPDRDPRGWAMLDAIDAVGRGEHVAAATQLESIVDVDDPLSAFAMMLEWYFLERADSLIGLMRRLHERHPELQFGSTLLMSLAQAGRDEDTDAFVAAWLARVPDSEQARAASAQAEASAGHYDQAAARATEIRLLFGDSAPRLVLACDVLTLSGRFAEASQIADRLLEMGDVGKQRAQYRLGVIASLEGRFAVAYQALQDAFALARPLGLSGETTQILEALQGVSAVLAPADEVRWTDELAVEYDRLGGLRMAALARYEAALLRRAPGAACPSIDDAIATIGAAQARNAARPDFLRAAQVRGCGSCADVVAAGRSFREGSPRSLMRFAACAVDEGAPELARQALQTVLERAASVSVGMSIDWPMEYVLAHHRLAAVERALGHADEARRLDQKFVDAWAHADRVIPELDEARKLLLNPD